MKPCPYRRDHEWEWEAARQAWLCIHCYATTQEPDSPFIRAIHDVVQPDSEKPTPPEPFPALEGRFVLPKGLRVSPRAILTCSMAGCSNPGKIMRVSGTFWSTRCIEHQ